MTSVPPTQPPAAPETDVNALVGDDIDYWLNNPFMPPDLLSKKVRYWVTQATAATTARAESAEAAHAALVADLREMAQGWIDRDPLNDWGCHHDNYRGRDVLDLLAGGEER